MAKYIDGTVMTGGLDVIEADCDKLHLITSYSLGDSHAVVVGASVCEVATDSSDFTIATLGTYEKKLTVATQSGTAGSSSGASPDLHFALCDTTGTVVLAVTDETSNQAITSGNPIDFPEFEIRVRQPT